LDGRVQLEGIQAGSQGEQVADLLGQGAVFVVGHQVLRGRLPLKKSVARYDALILDDIGYVQHGRDDMEVLFTLLAQR